jgi:hypothetical protein
MGRTYRVPKKLSPETQIKRMIKQYLNYKGWFHFPLTAGLGAYPGAPDMIAIKAGRVVFIEVKTPTGKLSPHQQAFKENIGDRGGNYIVARGIEDLEGEGI